MAHKCSVEVPPAVPACEEAVVCLAWKVHVLGKLCPGTS